MSNEQIKYPRTPHLTFSEGATSDDKMVSNEDYKRLKESPGAFLVTEKMDGGNITMTNKHFFARSLDSGVHSWDTPIKRLHSEIAHNIPEGYRINGESLFAKRSIGYKNLKSYFLVFSIVDENNRFLSWEETLEWVELLDLNTVPVLYRGDSFKNALNAWKDHGLNAAVSEGFVLRNAESFSYDNFSSNVVKYVRANHVRTANSWRGRDDFEKNTLR